MPFRRKYRILFLSLGLLFVVALALTIGLRKTVILSVDGKTRTIVTYSFTVGEVLHREGIPLSPSDKLSPSVNAWLGRQATVSLVRAIPVQIQADGKITSLYSPERTPSALFKQADIKVNPYDLLLSDGKTIPFDQAFSLNTASISLQLVRAVSFTLNENGETQQITSIAPTLGAALWAEGYALFATDRLNPPPTTPLTNGLATTLIRSRPVTIRTQAGEVAIRTAASLVGEALQAAHLSLQGLDYSQPAPDKPIPIDGIIRLVRVTEQVLIQQTPIAFKTEFQPDPNVEIDSQSVLQAGETGLTAQRVRVRYEEGVEASRKVEDEWVAREPTDRILGYGTLLVMHTTTVDGTTIQYWRMLSMYATSYHPSEVGDTTASGMPLQKGVVAIDRSIIPFYTQLYIPGYGQAVAGDTGGGVIGRWIDLGYSDSDYVPWHSWVTVYFLWPPPDNIVWVIP
jgi:uncharacterized protein YabE (DUF348 family)